MDQFLSFHVSHVNADEGTHGDADSKPSDWFVESVTSYLDEYSLLSLQQCRCAWYNDLSFSSAAWRVLLQRRNSCPPDVQLCTRRHFILEYKLRRLCRHLLEKGRDHFVVDVAGSNNYFALSQFRDHPSARARCLQCDDFVDYLLVGEPYDHCDQYWFYLHMWYGEENVYSGFVHEAKVRLDRMSEPPWDFRVAHVLTFTVPLSRPADFCRRNADGDLAVPTKALVIAVDKASEGNDIGELMGYFDDSLLETEGNSDNRSFACPVKLHGANCARLRLGVVELIIKFDTAERAVMDMTWQPYCEYLDSRQYEERRHSLADFPADARRVWRPDDEEADHYDIPPAASPL